MREKTNPAKHTERPRVVVDNEEWVRRLARSLVFDSNQAEDIVQQTWLEMFKRPPARGGNLRGWLTVVVKNVARKMRRSDRNREKRERRSAKEEALELPVGKQDKETLQKSILRAVESLDEPYRSAVRMRYFEELSPNEIAQRMNSPLDTVYTRLRRGLSQLRAKLDKQYGDRSLWTTVAIGWLRPAKLWSSGAVAAGFALLAVSASLLLLAVPGSPAEEEKVARAESETQSQESTNDSEIFRTPAPEIPVDGKVLEPGHSSEISSPDPAGEEETGAESPLVDPDSDPKKNVRIPERGKMGSNKSPDDPVDPKAQLKPMPKGGPNRASKTFKANTGFLKQGNN